MGNKTDLLYMAIWERLRQRGIVSQAASMIIYAMVTESVSYQVARDGYADWCGRAREQVQADLCYDVLKAGYDTMPAQLFAEIIGEVGPYEN